MVSAPYISGCLLTALLSVGGMLVYAGDLTEPDNAASREAPASSLTLSQGDTKIWLAAGVELEGVSDVVLNRAEDGTRVLLPPGTLEEITSTIRDALEHAGIRVTQPGAPLPEAAIQIHPVITRYEAGSAGARWLMPGMGATVCIMRATITDAMSGRVIGEILSWRHISAGGLFSIGADKYVPRETAEAIADALSREILGGP